MYGARGAGGGATGGVIGPPRVACREDCSDWTPPSNVPGLRSFVAGTPDCAPRCALRVACREVGSASASASASASSHRAHPCSHFLFYIYIFF